MAKKKVKKLYRAKEKDSMIAGVCGGIAEYSEVDPTVIRLLWVILTLVSFGLGVLAYLLAWIIIPRKK
jgi:phage shock protein C